MEDDWEIPEQPPAEEWEMPQASGEDWDEELMVPAQGRLVHVGQGQMHYSYFQQPTPGLLWPKKKKRRKRGKKKASSSPQSPPPEPDPAPLPPAPIDWSDWEELCQSAPPTPAPW